MSLTLCSQSPAELSTAISRDSSADHFIIACEYAELTCMYSNSLYVSEGNLK